MAYIVETILNIDKSFKDNKKKFDYDSEFVFSFYGRKIGNDKLKKINLKLKNIKKFSIFNVKKYNKKNFFVDLLKVGIIEADNASYNTHYKYVLMLKNFYFHKKTIETNKRLIKDKTKSGKIIKKYDVTYVVKID
jgi:hypothetical protein